jgi:hypothetical protein
MDFCSEEQVREVFGELMGDHQNIIKVTTLQKFNNDQSYKMFFIEFSKPNEVLTQLLNEIDSDPAEEHKRNVRVEYDARGHYWKVSRARKNDKPKTEEPFKPRILKRDEA